MAGAWHVHLPAAPQHLGWHARNVLEEIVLVPHTNWPCMQRSDSQLFHFPGTPYGTCRRALAVYSESESWATVTMTYTCCHGNRSPPLAVTLWEGMNIFVYCRDNYDNGYLAIDLLGGNSIQLLVPEGGLGGSYFYHGGNINDKSYDLHCHETPPRVAVVTNDSGSPPLPTLRTLTRMAAGELRVTRAPPSELPFSLRAVRFRFIMNMYEQGPRIVTIRHPDSP